MPELRAIVRDEPEDLVINFGDDIEVVLVYHPARITPLWLADLTAMSDPLALSNAFAGVISDWDIVQDGQPFPPSEENMATLPFPFLQKIAERLGQASAGGDEGKASSGSTPVQLPDSTTPSSTGTRRNGSATSTLPASIG